MQLSHLRPKLKQWLTVSLLVCGLLGPSFAVEGAQSATDTKYLFALIGERNTPEQVEKEVAAGVEAKILRVSWRDYMPLQNGVADQSYVRRKQEEIARLRAAGIKIILSMGVHDTPAWVHRDYENSYYVNQYGQRYAPTGIDNGDANLVFNPELRQAVAFYMQTLYKDLGTDFYAVRLGGGHWGELTYPHHTYLSSKNCYWAFDANALRTNPVPNWRPGQPSPNNEAGQFLNWYLDALVDYQNWQIAQVRKHYSGQLMMLYPSWGIRPGQVEEAIAVNLDGSTSAEINGEIQRGFDFARQISAVTDPLLVVTTTWIDAPANADNTRNSRQWSPVKYLSSLADAHPLKLAKFGENTGQGDISRMQLSVFQMQRNGLIGLAWYRAEEMTDPRYANLNDYARTISSYNKTGK